MQGFPTPDPATVFPEGLEPNQEDNEKRSLNKLVGLSQLILERIQAGIGGVAWGAITGTLSNQTDLQNALIVRPIRSAPAFVTSVNGGTVAFVNNSTDQDLYDDGADPGVGGTNIVNLPSNATSSIGQKVIYYRLNQVSADSVTITFDQSGGGLSLYGPMPNPIALIGAGTSICFQKVAANTWSAEQICGSISGV